MFLLNTITLPNRISILFFVALILLISCNENTNKLSENNSTSDSLTQISDKDKQPTDSNIRIAKMKFVSYSCGDNCYMSFMNVGTGKEESFMFWDNHGVINEIEDNGDTEDKKSKHQGKIFEVTLNKQLKKWMDTISMKETKEQVWVIVEMKPLEDKIASTKTDLPFIGKKYFDNSMIATTYVVDIKSDGRTIVTAGGPGMDNTGSIIYKGEYKSIMRGKEEGIKIENGILYLLDANGAVSNECAGDTPCKFSIKTESLIK